MQGMFMNALKFRAAVAVLILIGLVNANEARADGEQQHRRHRKEDGGHGPTYGDPYAYQYTARGYYPAYNLGYWRPAGEVRARDLDHYNDWINGNCYEQVPNYGYRRCHTETIRRWHY